MDTSTVIDPDKQEVIEHLERGLNVEFAGNESKILESTFCDAIRVKKLGQVKTDLLITSKRVIVAPAGKDRSEAFGVGALLGPLGLFATGALGAVEGALSKKAKRKVDVQDRFSKEDLYSCVVWERSGMTFSVFEERTEWDLMGGEWATFPRFSGPCQYQGKTISAGAEFYFYGRLNNIALRSKPKKLLPILDIFQFTADRVVKR